MTDSKELEKLISDSGLKKNFIAKKMGITAYGLSNKVNGRSEFKASEIQTMCELLKINQQQREIIFFA